MTIVAAIACTDPPARPTSTNGQPLGGIPPACINLISRPENRQLLEWKAGEVVPHPCGRALCAVGSPNTLARYDGDVLVVAVAGAEPLRVPGARTKDLLFTQHGAAVWQKAQRALTVATSGPGEPFHGKRYTVPPFGPAEELAGVSVLATGVYLAVEDHVPGTCGPEPIGRRTMVLDGARDGSAPGSVFDEDHVLRATILATADGHVLERVDGGRVPIPASLELKLNNVQTHWRAGWTYVLAEGGWFLQHAGDPPLTRPVTERIDSTDFGPRILEHSGRLVALHPDGREEVLLDAAPTRAMSGEPIAAGTVIARRIARQLDTRRATWTERLRDATCAIEDRLYLVDYADGRITPLASGPGQRSHPFAFGDAIFWTETQIRYEMVAME